MVSIHHFMKHFIAVVPSFYSLSITILSPPPSLSFSSSNVMCVHYTHLEQCRWDPIPSVYSCSPAEGCAQVISSSEPPDAPVCAVTAQETPDTHFTNGYLHQQY